MAIASITKTFTATVILQLVEEGMLRLNDPVKRYLDRVPRGPRLLERDPALDGPVAARVLDLSARLLVSFEVRPELALRLGSLGEQFLHLVWLACGGHLVLIGNANVAVARRK